MAKVRAEKTEDVFSKLTTKTRQLDTEADLCTEKLGITSLQLKEKEKFLLAAEAKMNDLTRDSPALWRTWGRETTAGRHCCKPSPLQMTLSAPRRLVGGRSSNSKRN